jgi:hypothetical protein
MSLNAVSTAFYGIYDILRHSTAFTAIYGILRHFTAFYRRHFTAFYGINYGKLSSIASTVSSSLLPIMKDVEGGLAQVRGVLQSNTDSLKGVLVLVGPMTEQSTQAIIEFEPAPAGSGGRIRSLRSP